MEWSVKHCDSLPNLSDILQGSVATCLRCVGSLVMVLLQIFSWFWQWKNFENRLIFEKVIRRTKIVPIFGHPAYEYSLCCCALFTLFLNNLCTERLVSELLVLTGRDTKSADSLMHEGPEVEKCGGALTYNRTLFYTRHVSCPMKNKLRFYVPLKTK